MKSTRFKALAAFIRKYSFLLFLGLLTLLFVVGLILSSLTPPIPRDQPNEFAGLVPGYHYSNKQIEEQFGKPIRSESSIYGKELSFQSSYPLLPHEVVLNSDEVVLFVRERIPETTEENISSYIDQWGEPDLRLYVPDVLSLEASVFLEKGVVIIAHRGDGSLEQKWYFSPTTEDVFLSSWGGTLSQEPETHPHPAEALLDQ